MPKTKKPSRHLTIYLIKKQHKRFADVLRDKIAASRFIRSSVRGVNAVLYLPDAPENIPLWAEFVREGFGQAIDVAKNASSAALLLLRANKRIFAITFGHARGLMDRECYERDFGLKVVVNRVDPQQIRSISLRMFKELAMRRQEEAARGTRLGTFGVDVRQDLLRAVTGNPRNANFATKVSGSDSVIIDTTVRFSELPSKCEELLRAFNEKRYTKAGFDWIDNLRTIRDHNLISHLDTELINALKSRDGSIQLMPPDSLGNEAVEGFKYEDEAEDDQLHPSLEMADWWAAIGNELPNLEAADIRKRRISAYVNDTPIDVEEREWFVFETERKGKRYILSGGSWFEVSSNFNKQIRDYIRGISIDRIRLPRARPNEIEERYIGRVVGGSAQLMSMHTVNFRLPNDNPVELCDLLSGRGELIHVKRWKSSSTFSHLLAQGAVSAETIVRFPSARRLVRDRASLHRRTINALFPQDGFVPSKLTVVFALIHPGSQELPFFSRLNLMREGERVERLGYRVAFQKIPIH